MKIGGHDFDLEHKGYIMGILNVTPDSFSDGGRWQSLDAALSQAEQMAADGAAILDIGGESTRPGHVKISDEEEIERVVPVIEAVKARLDIPVSLDTYKYAVAKAGLDAGADMINDIWGLRWEDGGRLAGLIAGTGAACCLMHNRKDENYADFLTDYREDLRETLRIADAAGISRQRIVLDPGVGFAKTYEQNLLVINHLELLAEFGLPVLLGTSRKRVIGTALDLPVHEREEGTAAITVIGRMKGASLFRVHDVKSNYRALRMTEAVLNAG